MFLLSCTFLSLFLFLLGISGNNLCIVVFLRQKFRHRIITPYFIALLVADSIYLLFRLIKLFYYSQTLFHRNVHSSQSCSTSLIIRIYQYATQTWPQIFIPLIHSETYIRFSIILMCIISVQRTTFITRSLKQLVLPPLYNDKCKHRWTFVFIILAFSLAYSLEFFGLTIFCSKSNNSDVSYQWFTYMAKYMENSSSLLTSTINNQSEALQCVNDHLKNETLSLCTKEELIKILSDYFDQHSRSIVNLIQKIIQHQTGHRIARNEIRRKFHFHECVFAQDPQFFHRHYDFMYKRTFGFNRYALILVCGIILPSLITIISNGLTVCRIQQLNRLTSNYIIACRRRTDDTRRVLVIISVECIFAIVNSWFSDMLISLIYCQGKLLADDDCPKYLKANYSLLVMFDMFNSVSNIALHYLCEKHFRHELRRIFQYWQRRFKQFYNNICCCSFKLRCPKNNDQSYVYYNVSVTNNMRGSNSDPQNHEYVYFKISKSRRIRPNLCCDCHWYSNRTAFQRYFSSLKQEYLNKNRVSFSFQSYPLIRRPRLTSSSMRNSMTLNLAQQQTVTTRKLSSK